MRVTNDIPLGWVFTPLLRLKRCHACDQWHSSRVGVQSFTGLHCKYCPNTKGPAMHGLGGSAAGGGGEEGAVEPEDAYGELG
jgi:hypothetical protein